MNEDIKQYICQDTCQTHRMFMIKTGFFMDLVTSAAYKIIEHLNPSTSGYIEGSDNIDKSVTNHFGGELWIDQYTFNPRKWYLALWSQVELLQLYASMRNENQGTKFKWMFGEDAETISLVYHALVFANNWKVSCIYKTHEAHGKNFGSATGWQTVDILSHVKDWPELYGFQKMVDIEPLPKDVPGYMDGTHQEES